MFILEGPYVGGFLGGRCERVFCFGFRFFHISAHAVYSVLPSALPYIMYPSRFGPTIHGTLSSTLVGVSPARALNM